MTTLINLYGGPGSGKTTTAYKISGALKEIGKAAVYVPEYATDLCYSHGLVDAHQSDILNEQFQRMFRYFGTADFVVTDSPLLMQLAYVEPGTALEEKIKALAGVYKDQWHYGVLRNPAKQHDMRGRMHNLEQAKEMDKDIDRLVRQYVNLSTMYSDDIIRDVMNKVGN